MNKEDVSKINVKNPVKHVKIIINQPVLHAKEVCYTKMYATKIVVRKGLILLNGFVKNVKQDVIHVTLDFAMNAMKVLDIFWIKTTNVI